MKDRQLNFIDEDMVVCQENCDFVKFDFETVKAECSCKVKKSSSSFVDININKEKLLENFKNIFHWIYNRICSKCFIF